MNQLSEISRIFFIRSSILDLLIPREEPHRERPGLLYLLLPGIRSI